MTLSVPVTVLHGGNLRLFGAPPPWQADYADTLGPLSIFAENAFGAQYCVGPDGLVVGLDPESRNLDEAGVAPAEFLAFVDSDPAYAIDQALYEDCCATHGAPGVHQHFDFVVPLVLGGAIAVANVQRLPARQLQGVPAGTRIRQVLLGD
jgi:hypothetical protein